MHGVVVWDFGTLSAGRSRTVNMQPQVWNGVSNFGDGGPAPADGTTLQSVAKVISSGGDSAKSQLTVSVGFNWPTIDPIPPYQIAEGKLLNFTVIAKDADIPTQTLSFGLDGTIPPGANIDPRTGVFTWTPTRAQGPSTNSITVRVTDSSPKQLSTTQTFTVVVIEVNDPPVITAIPNQTIIEGSALSLAVSVADADLPQQELAFTLAAGSPIGASIDPVTGIFNWTPTEAQGPSTNTIKVTDNGTPSLSDTKSFTVIVNEVNLSPSLTGIANQVVNEETLLTFTASANDPDLPAQQLTFSLGLDAPAGATIDAATGVFRWTPTEAQGPSTNAITVRVADNGSPSLTDTKTFTVVVNEVNVAPVLTAIGIQTVNDHSVLTNFVTATDTDFPKNTLRFSLDGNPPSGASIDPVTGVFTWPIGEVLASSTNVITVRVVDNGSPSLSDTKSFTVVVNAPKLRLSPIPDQTANEGARVLLSATVTNSPLAKAPFTFSLDPGAPSGATITPSGAFFWLTTEAQGPSTNTITVRVTDSSAPPLSATQRFTVFVKEVNLAPVLDAIPRQTNAVGQTLTIQLRATDEDFPANKLKFSLDPGAPSGAGIDQITDVFTWTPAPAYASTTNNITIRVTDDGFPALSDMKSFTVVVTPVPPLKLSGKMLSSGQFQLMLSTEPGRTYFVETSSNLRDWALITNVLSAATSVQIVDPGSLGLKQRFYRAASPP